MPIMDQQMESQSRPSDLACKGRSPEMAAWRYLVLEEGQIDEPGIGRATALLDMTKCFAQVVLWHVWRWGCHWNFPSLLRVIILVFSFQRRVGLWGAASGAHPDVRCDHCWAGLFVRDPAHAVPLAMRLLDEQVASTATHEVCGRSHNQLQCKGLHCCSDDPATISEAVSLWTGWLEAGLDFHVSKVEGGAEGKSVVLVSNFALKTVLTAKMKALGMRVVSHARILGVNSFGVGASKRRKTQYRRLVSVKKRMPKVEFFKKCGAITSKIAEAGVIPSGLRSLRCMGLPPTRVKAFRTTIERCLPGKHAWRSRTWRQAAHECDPIHACRVEIQSCTRRGGDNNNSSV